MARSDSSRSSDHRRAVTSPNRGSATTVESRARGHPVATTSINRPGRADITPTRSANMAASSSACVMRTTVAPVSRHSRSSSSPMSRRVCWSRAANGSSSRIRRGRSTSVRAMQTRCRMPPGTVPLTRFPSKMTSPSLGASSPATMSISVDLPQPDGPMMAKNSPALMSRSTPCRAHTGSRAAARKTRLMPRNDRTACIGWEDSGKRSTFQAVNHCQEHGTSRAGKQKEQQDDGHHRRHIIHADRRHEQMAESTGRGEHFADQHAEQCQRKADPQSRHDLRHDGRQQDPPHIAPSLQAHRPCGLAVDWPERADAPGGHDCDGRQAVQDAKGDLGGVSQAEKQQDDRIKRDLRDRDQYMQPGFECLAQHARRPEQQAKPHAAAHGETERNGIGLARCAQVPEKTRFCQQGDATRDRLHRSRQDTHAERDRYGFPDDEETEAQESNVGDAASASERHGPPSATRPRKRRSPPLISTTSSASASTSPYMRSV